MQTIRILILEDDLKTLSILLDRIYILEEELLEKGKDLSVVVLSEYTQVEEYLNKLDENKFDVILLDRDCKIGGSFHCLDFDIYSVDKIIGISSTPAYNEELRQRGVQRIVLKKYQNLNVFSQKVIEEIKKMLLEV